MTWPSILPNSAAFDADADSVAASRPELKKMSDAVNTMASNVFTGGSTTGTITPDVANGEIQRITLTGNITMNAFANPVAGQRLMMIFKQPAAGPTFNLSSNMLWENGLESLTQINGAVDTADIFFDGTDYYARINLAHGSVEVYAISVNPLNEDLDVNNFKIVNNVTNGHIQLEPNGTGDVQLTTDTVRVGDLNANAFITTNGTGNLVLTTGGSTPPSITLQTSNTIIADNDILITTGKSGGSQGQIFLQANALYLDTRTTLPNSISISTVGESLNLQSGAPPGGGTGGQITLFAKDTTNGNITIDGGQSITGTGGVIELTTQATGDIKLTPSINATINCSDRILRQVEFKDYAETVYNQGNVTGSLSITVANGNTQRMRLTGNITFTGFADAREGQTVTLLITQDGTGGRTFTEGLDSANRMLFAGGVSTLSTGANAIDIMTISYIGGTYFASINKGYV